MQCCGYRYERWVLHQLGRCSWLLCLGCRNTEKCINIAHEAAVRNNLTHLIHFINKPISNIIEDVVLKVDVANCDALYSIGRPDECNICPQRIQRHKYVDATFVTTSVDHFFPSPIFIDFMKIDTEGHDPHVFAGAMNALTEKRVGVIVAEVAPKMWDMPREKAITVYSSIFNLGYTALCLNGRAKGITFNSKNLDYFLQTSGVQNCTDFEFRPAP